MPRKFKTVFGFMRHEQRKIELSVGRDSVNYEKNINERWRYALNRGFANFDLDCQTDASEKPRVALMRLDDETPVSNGAKKHLVLRAMIAWFAQRDLDRFHAARTKKAA